MAAADFWRESAARRGERCVSDARCDPGGAHVAEEEHGGWRLQGCRQSLVLGSATTRLQFVVALHGCRLRIRVVLPLLCRWSRVLLGLLFSVPTAMSDERWFGCLRSLPAGASAAHGRGS